MTDFHFEGSNEQNTSLRFEGLFNYLEEIPSELFELSYSNFPLNNMHLSDSRYIPDKVEKGSGTVNGKLELNGDKLNGTVKFAGRSLAFAEAGESGELSKAQQIIRDVIRQTNNINFNARISGEGDDLKFSLNSNLDELFVEILNAVVGKVVEKD
jgi:hypothetical protein